MISEIFFSLVPLKDYLITSNDYLILQSSGKGGKMVINCECESNKSFFFFFKFRESNKT